MIRIFIAAALGILLVGCSSFDSKNTKTALATAGGAAGGGAIGYAASDGDPLWTGVGAGSGALVGLFASEYAESEEQMAFESGYVQGRSDSIKDLYFSKQRNEKYNHPPTNNSSGGKMQYYIVPANTERPDGVKLKPHTITVPIVE